MRKSPDRVCCVVLCLGNTTGFIEVVDFDCLGFSAFGGEDHGECSFLIDDTVFGTVLVAEGVAADNNGSFPAGNEAGNGGDHDGFTEDSAAEDVTDCAVRGQPHCVVVSDLITIVAGRRGNVLFFSLNSSTLASSGVMVAHLTPTEYFLMASAASMVTWSSVSSL